MSRFSASKDVAILPDIEYQPLSDCGSPRATACDASGLTRELSWYQAFTAFIWLMASLQMLATCYFAWPLLPAPCATAMCAMASCAAMCSIVASVMELCWRPTAADSGEIVQHNKQ